ncbi:MAG: LysR substrate-binding domain-containing protein [Pseudomonadota bacterium]
MQPTAVDTDLIRTFVAVCDVGSFRAAASHVHRTPSAVSMQMAKLEEQVNAGLFRKEGRTVKLTPAGEEFLGYARRILSLHAEALARVSGPKLGGLVRVGVPDDYELRLLTEALPRFARFCPDVEIDVSVDYSVNLIERVQAGELDLTFVEARPLRNRAHGEIVRAEPLVWVGREGGMAKLRRPLPLALPGKMCYWRHTALDALERARIPHRVAFTAEFSHGQVAAMHADLAVAPLPASHVVAGLERIAASEGLPSLGTVTVCLALSPQASETTHALADAIRAGETQPAVGIA